MIWNFEHFEKKDAIVDEYGLRVSYKDLVVAGEKISSVINKRSLVFVMCKNTVGSVVGYASFVNRGMVSVLLNAQLEKKMLTNLIKTYKPKYIWTTIDSCDEYDAYGCKKKFELYDYALLQTSFDEEYELYDELCILLTTSGSTGSPKFVRQSYANVEANAKSIVEYLKLDDSEKPITTLPMNYTYGLSIINSHFFVGATLLVTEKGLMQKEFWNFFKSEGATSFGGVPYTYEILEKLRFFRMELPSLRYMTQAGGKLTPELHKKFAEYAEEKNKKFIVMYGQCEATARMGYLPAEKSLEKYGSMGIAIPGGDFKLIDTNGEEIHEPYVTGELVYSGPNVTLGYAECGDDLQKGDERFGILYTGDMAQFDEDGYYFIVGRKKRFLKIFGNRVNLDEIDRMIKTEFNNIEVASAGKDDHMYIFITDHVYETEVVKFVAEKTRLNPTAFKAVVIDSIPKNDAGKTLYKELTKYYE